MSKLKCSAQIVSFYLNGGQERVTYYRIYRARDVMRRKETPFLLDVGKQQGVTGYWRGKEIGRAHV